MLPTRLALEHLALSPLDAANASGVLWSVSFINGFGSEGTLSIASSKRPANDFFTALQYTSASCLFAKRPGL